MNTPSRLRSLHNHAVERDVLTLRYKRFACVPCVRSVHPAQRGILITTIYVFIVNKKLFSSEATYAAPHVLPDTKCEASSH